MHVFVTAEYTVSLIYRSGCSAKAGLCKDTFTDPLTALPKLSEADVSVEIGEPESVLVYHGGTKYPADKVDVKVFLDHDIKGRIDVSLLRHRLTRAFVGLVKDFESEESVIDAYQMHPAVRIIEVVKDESRTTFEFKPKTGVADVSDKQERRNDEGLPETADESRQRFGLKRLFGRAR